MAYQNVGTPRFYISILQYLKSLGQTTFNSSTFVGADNMNPLDINPANQTTLSEGSGIDDYISYGTGVPLSTIMPNDKNFVMVLGHNFQSAGLTMKVQEYTSSEQIGSAGDVVNACNQGGGSPHDGFSIMRGNDAADLTSSSIKFRFDALSNSQYNVHRKIGSLLYGTYYDMPHSPDLNLKMSIEMDGVKNIKTKGGASLTDISYTKPQDWGDMGAWQLSSTLEEWELGEEVNLLGGSQSAVPSNLRSGRRVWDLSFSYLSDTDVMPANASQSYSSGSEEDDFETNILDGTDFFSQVWNRTMGGHLPFIFQPDNGNANPDQFAICRFDMKSLTYDQVANNVYNVKLKIRECW